MSGGLGLGSRGSGLAWLLGWQAPGCIHPLLPSACPCPGRGGSLFFQPVSLIVVFNGYE